MSGPELDTTRLANQFRTLGLAPGDAVLVHSSLRALGQVVGGAPAVVDALLGATAPGGTVLFPTLTGAATDSPENPPHCDTRCDTTWCGRIPCAALAHEAHHRSLHPTHSVAAIGELARWITTGHEHSVSPCGPGSPYTRLAEIGGRILLIGVGHESNTTFHTAEELADLPYVSYPGIHPAVVIDPSGDVLTVRTPIHRWDRPRRFEAWHEALLSEGVVTCGTVGAAPCRLMYAQSLLDWLADLLARDPQALLADPESPG